MVEDRDWSQPGDTINILKPIISALKANGQVKRGWIGVLVAPVLAGSKGAIAAIT